MNTPNPLLLNRPLLRAVLANVLLAALVAATVGSFLLLDVPAGGALLAGAVVFVLAKMDEARIRRARRRQTVAA